MNKQEKTRIKFDYNGKSYTLEFTADSLRRMQNSGFNFGDLESQAVTVGEELFAGAFIANHQSVPHRKRVEIYHELCEESADGDTITEILVAMVNEAFEEINQHKGNVKWEVVDSTTN